MPFFGKKENHTGYLDDMSEEQEQVLNDFKSEIQDQNITDDTRFDDSYLLRYWRATNFKLNKTIKLFKDFIEWRKEIDADNAIVNYRYISHHFNWTFKSFA